jgi:hypothetical protein
LDSRGGVPPREQSAHRDTLDASVEAMRRPEARLITRLGEGHTLTKAYALAERAFGNLSYCAESSENPGDEDAALSARLAVEYFNHAAAAIAGTSLGTNPSLRPPSRQALDQLDKKIESLQDCSPWLVQALAPATATSSYQSAWTTSPLCSVDALPFAVQSMNAGRSCQDSTANRQCSATPAGAS